MIDLWAELVFLSIEICLLIVNGDYYVLVFDYNAFSLLFTSIGIQSLVETNFIFPHDHHVFFLAHQESLVSIQLSV